MQKDEGRVRSIATRPFDKLRAGPCRKRNDGPPAPARRLTGVVYRGGKGYTPSRPPQTRAGHAAREGQGWLRCEGMDTSFCTYA